MLEYLRKNIANFFDDFGYNARAAITHAVGEGSIKGGSIFTGQALATTLSASTAAFPIAMIIGIPVCTGFSAALVQQDHLHRRFKLTQEFNQEIAAWLQRSGTAKKPGEVTDQDLDLAAYGDAKQGIPGNPSLAAALDHSRHERNWGVAISAVATAIATTLVFGLKAAEALPTFGALAALAGPLAVAAELMVAGAIGFAIYTATKVPMHWVAEQLFDLEKTTVVDRVRDIRRALEHGQKISETKVFEVFLEAHPELARAVRREHGRSFDSLSLKDQAQVAAAFGPSIHLRQLTADINSGAVRPEELA
ncbi:MAG: hypothetical protein JO089_07495, partial [Alphaproteobacteria bacterium]|nr:hypothetical protein [Alphaproteobacteria bacterium]